MTRLDDWRREHDPSTSFGELRTGSNRIGQALGAAQQQGARNLLRKAERAQAAGDREAADRFVARAIALGRDEHNEMFVAPWEAHMLLYMAVTDAAEEHDEESPAVPWLDAAETALRTCPPAARQELANILHLLAREFPLSDAEQRRLGDLLREHPATEPLEPGAEELDPERILAVLACLSAYERALEAAERLGR